MDRRGFLSRVAAGAVGVPACRTAATDRPAGADALATDWGAVRAEFPLGRDHVHLALMLLTSHPRPVREAIERHRRGLDENPVGYFEERFFRLDGETRAAVARYTGGEAGDVALTDSTTMGLGVLYGGLALADGDEVITTTHDHYSTHETLRLRGVRERGVKVRKVALYDDPARANEDEIAKRLVAAIGPRTRAVAITWVHSSTGVKLPVARLAAEIDRANRGRADADRVLLCVDGVHGFGVERERVADLGCDFFVAGCHKWMFGPRGTGIVWGRKPAWKRHTGLVAPFEREPYEAWMQGRVPTSPGGPLATPGGFHSFEHRWALPEAFAFHERIGRDRITSRIHELAQQAKQGLAAMSHVVVRTPASQSLSSALVCFDVQGVPAETVVKRLGEKRIIASATPYATTYARLSPGILNTPQEIDRVLAEVRAMKV